MIGGNADGHVYALQAQDREEGVGVRALQARRQRVAGGRGRPGVHLPQRGERRRGRARSRTVAIDATGSGDVTDSHEIWRWNRNQAGFPSPAVHDGRVYVVDNSANLAALDVATGEIYWELSVGTVGKASPVCGGRQDLRGRDQRPHGHRRVRRSRGQDPESSSARPSMGAATPSSTARLPSPTGASISPPRRVSTASVTSQRSSG